MVIPVWICSVVSGALHPRSMAPWDTLYYLGK
jgi:hypothetical protein